LKKAERPVRGRPGVRSSDRNLTFGRGTELSGGRTLADRATVTKQMGSEVVRVNLRFFGNRHAEITYPARSLCKGTVLMPPRLR
jgi:hypothetical protein